MKAVLKTVLALAVVLVSLTAFGQKKTQNFQVTSIIKASADKVWAVVGEDFGGIAKSHPQIVSSDYINGTLKSGEGAERVCNYNDAGTKYLHEKQINYSPEKYTFEVQIFHIAGLPLDSDVGRAIYKVEAIDENSSKLIFDMTYRTKPAFLGGMMKGKFQKTIKDYALAIEHHVLTGETVNKDNFKEIKKSSK